MPRSAWDDLPESVRAAIEREVGVVVRAEVPSAGRNSDFSATLHLGGGGRLFCKGIDVKSKCDAMHRHEADINPWLPLAVAPRLRWRVEVDDWLMLGFDHAAGHHADLSPGSLDMPVVAATVAVLGSELADCSPGAPRLAEQWRRLAPWRRMARDTPATLDRWAREHLGQLAYWEARAAEAADGADLVHTDLHPLNILVSGDRAHVVDWAWSRTGAVAVDVAFLIARLVVAGHTPAQAERWAEALPVWQATCPEARTALAVAIWGIWEYQRHAQPRPLWSRLIPAARAVAHHRLGVPSHFSLS